MSTNLAAKAASIADTTAPRYVSYIKLNGELMWSSQLLDMPSVFDAAAVSDLTALLAHSGAHLSHWLDEESLHAHGTFRGVAAIGPLPFLVVVTRVELTRTNGISPVRATILYNRIVTSGKSWEA